MQTLKLPRSDGRLAAYTLSGKPIAGVATARPRWNRVAFAAAHVVADPLANVDPWLSAAIDWDATLAYRRYLWAQGFGVAEAMDTAQRGMGLDWPTSLELIGRTVAESRGVAGAVVFSGAGTDDVAPDPDGSIERVIDAYATQCAAIERAGGRIILMASRALAACARSADDYERVYSRVLANVERPVILHWLGEMFDPALAGYWLGRDERGRDPEHARAMDVCARVIAANRAKIDGIKISLLDADKEIALRARLPAGVRMYTGDDFNFAALIGGDARRPFGCAARHLRCDRTGGFHGIVRAGRRRSRPVRRDAGADGSAVAAHLRGADALLQDGRGVHGVAQRPPVAFHDGRRTAKRAKPRASRRAVPAGRCRFAAARSRTRGRADAHAARDCTASTMNSPDPALLSINTATVRAQWPLPEIISGLRASRHPRHIAVARPGGGRGARRQRAAHS